MNFCIVMETVREQHWLASYPLPRVLLTRGPLNASTAQDSPSQANCQGFDKPSDNN